jgi:DNA-damage-inducible protein J
LDVCDGAHWLFVMKKAAGRCDSIEVQRNEGAFLMAANALVQTRIDPALKERAAVVLEKLGITISDAVRILLTRTANEGELPFALTNSAAHDAWFRRQGAGSAGRSTPRHAARKGRSALRQAASCSAAQRTVGKM